MGLAQNINYYRPRPPFASIAPQYANISLPYRAVAHRAPCRDFPIMQPFCRADGSRYQWRKFLHERQSLWPRIYFSSIDCVQKVEGHNPQSSEPLVKYMYHAKPAYFRWSPRRIAAGYNSDRNLSPTVSRSPSKHSYRRPGS